jgi:hypothetical protein
MRGLSWQFLKWPVDISTTISNGLVIIIRSLSSTVLQLILVTEGHISRNTHSPSAIEMVAGARCLAPPPPSPPPPAVQQICECYRPRNALTFDLPTALPVDNYAAGWKESFI